MTTSAFQKDSPNTANTNVFNNNDLLVFWYQPWVETSHSAAKLHCIWLETLNDAFRHEIDFLAAMAPVYSKLTHCMLGVNGPLTPESMTSCYHQIAGEMTEATFNRIRRVSELSEDFKERIWCEL
ncbi:MULTISPECIES: hypothetical protein [unclassified Halomonas]|uniref:hypothetical protein n=1 Tax=unclassified Halomonas TaxID=2609666 RepID=UPI001CF13C6B|nr:MULTISPECIES: hypothetical protein [unclassified Halomonas]MCA8865282.1 hypothetical protein [Halomonas sp. SBBP1]UZH12242.1 hypothetical protein OM794_11120 [Halomonas sp. BDJS001]